MTRQEIRNAREYWDIRQFVLRGSLRNWQCDDPYTIYVYDEAQAKMLTAYINDEGIGYATMHGIPEAGIMDLKRPSESKNGKERKARRRQTDEERKLYDKTRKQKKREEANAIAVANGTKRPRGRPRKGVPPQIAPAMVLPTQHP